MCTEHYGDWSLHNQHFSGINDILSLTAKLLKPLSLRDCLIMSFSQEMIPEIFREDKLFLAEH